MKDTWSEEHRAECEARYINSLIPADRARFIFKCREARSPEAVEALLARARQIAPQEPRE